MPRQEFIFHIHTFRGGETDAICCVQMRLKSYYYFVLLQTLTDSIIRIRVLIDTNAHAYANVLPTLILDAELHWI